MPGVGDIAGTLSTQMANAPLPEMIQRLGLSIAQAQAALDQNAIQTAREMAATTIKFDSGREYNMLTLGFMPSFYAFTEAKIEAKLAFSMSKSVEFGIAGSVSGNIGIVAVSVEASYSQKFSMSAEGSSSVSARLVSVPAPDIFREILQREYQSQINADGSVEPPANNPE
jgi:hypothetical protein